VRLNSLSDGRALSPPMTKIIASGLPQLRPFQLDLRDKAAVAGLLSKLNIQLLGWNLPNVCDTHFLSIPYNASLDTHRNSLCVLIAILVSLDGEHLLKDSDALLIKIILEKNFLLRL
jgi:hypothetical protein